MDGDLAEDGLPYFVTRDPSDEPRIQRTGNLLHSSSTFSCEGKKSLQIATG